MATWEDASRNSFLDDLDDQVNAGTGTGGFFVFEDSSDNSIAACDMSASAAFGAASGGSMTANAIGTATATSATSIEHVSLYNTDGTKIVELTCATATADVIVNDTSFASGATITVSSLVVTCPSTS